MVIASFAYSMMQVGQAVVAYDLTGKNGAVGIVTLCGGVATLVVSPFGGVLSDRISRNLLLTVGQGAIGVVLTITGTLLLLDRLHIALLAAFAATTGGLFGVVVPARQAMVRGLLPPAAVANGVALQQVAFTSARVVGPFAVGFLISLAFVQTGGAYLAMATMMVLAVVMFSGLPDIGVPGARGVSFFRDLGDGLAHVARTPRLALQFGTQIGFVMFGVTYTVLLPGFLHNELGHGKSGVAVLYGAAAAGGLISSFGVAGLAGSRHVARIIAAAMVVMAAGLLALAAAPGFVQAAGAVLVTGLGAGAFQALNQAYILQECDPRHLGKVSALSLMAFGFGQMASYPIGFFADRAGEPATFALMGLLLMAVAGTAALVQAGITRSQGGGEAGSVLAPAPVHSDD